MRSPTVVIGLLVCTLTGCAQTEVHRHTPKLSTLPAHCTTPDATPSLRCASVSTPTFDKKGHLWVSWVQGPHVYVSRQGREETEFAAPVRVNPQPEAVEHNGENRPKIVVAGNGDIYLSYSVRKPQPYTGDVRFSRSLDGGKHFSPPSSISDEARPSSQRFDALAVSASGRIYLAWLDKRTKLAARQEKKPYPGIALYFSYSDDRGASFSPNQIIRHHSCECCRLAMVINNDRPALMWRSVYGKNVRDHSFMVFKNPTNPGVSTPTRVSQDQWAIDACPHHGPAMSMDKEGTYHTVWFTNGTARQGLFYARSSDGGNRFSPPLGFGNPKHQSTHPHIASLGKRVFIVWKEFDGKQTQIRMMQSTDYGKRWSAVSSVATTAGASDHPLLLSNGLQVYLWWQTAAEGHRRLMLN